MSDMDNLPIKHFFSIFIYPFKYARKRDDGKADSIPNGPADPKPSDLANDLSAIGWHTVPEFLNEKPNEFGRDESLEANYNEWHYFHPAVRDMIFSKQDSPMRFLTRSDYVELSVSWLKTRNLLLDSGDEEEEISQDSVVMNVPSIDLHLFDNQTGLLTISTQIPDGAQYEFGKLVRYNDLARRVYPPFLGFIDSNDVRKAKKEKPYTQDSLNSLQSWLSIIGDTLKSNTLATKLTPYIPFTIELTKRDQPGNPLRENFSNRELPQRKERVSKIVDGLLMGEQNSTPIITKWEFESFTDDRMFIVSCVLNNELSSAIGGRNGEEMKYEKSDDWYRFLFVDGGDPYIGNSTMKQLLLREHTYNRWSDCGTLYGMSRYSFVALMNESNFAKDILSLHVKSIYYQMALVILFQRAMLLEFSSKVKDLIADFPDPHEIDESFFKRADMLYHDFIEFTTKYWFEEITPQEQGIEMYGRWKDLMRLDALYDDVKEEVDQLARYVQTKIGHATDKTIETLTDQVKWMTVGIVVLTLWLALYGEMSLPYFFKLAHEAPLSTYKPEMIPVLSYCFPILLLALFTLSVLVLLTMWFAPKWYARMKESWKQIMRELDGSK
jgi:hypothetical protein